MHQAMEMGGIRLIEAVARHLPQRAALAFGRSLGHVAWNLRIRRAVCEQNLTRALGDEWDASQRRRIAIASYEHLGMLIVEFFRILHERESQRRALLEIEGLEHFERALDAGRGAIVVTGHYGNWEAVGACAVAHGLPVTVVVQRLRNRRVDTFLWNAREAQGMQILERGMALRGVEEHLKANRLVTFLSDQDARQRGMFVPFFGTPASTPKGAAQLSLRHGVPFIPFFGRRLAGGHHRLTVYPPLEPPVAVDPEAAVCSLLGRFNGILEEAIRAEPGQYLWLHRRWKTSPPAARALVP